MVLALQLLGVTDFGATRVHAPELVLAGELQYRLEFSHRISPPQLLTNVLPVIANCFPYGPAPRASEPDSEMEIAPGGKPWLDGPAPRPLRSNTLFLIWALS